VYALVSLVGQNMDTMSDHVRSRPDETPSEAETTQAQPPPPTVLPDVERASDIWTTYHMPWWVRVARLLALVALLYGFLVGVDILGEGISGLGSGTADSLFRGVANPIAGLAIGVLATVLVQSSSVSTSTIVALVGTGVLSVSAAVPMVMGANIGTTVTNTLASLGAVRRTNDFRRAFAGATVHDLFNLLAVAVLLPLELLTGVLSRAAIALSGPLAGATGGEFESPLKAAVGAGAAAFESLVGVVPGQASAALLIVLGLGLLFATLALITKNMRLLIAGAAERSLNAVLGRSGTLGILVGIALTVAVQSSSITTSLLVPMMAAGVLTLRNAYPITLGANVGTTVTALLAALAVPQIEGLQIALVHLLFNVAGILLFFPVPALRRIPIAGAERLADLAARRKSLVLVYIVGVLMVLPATIVLIVD
jgi:sodium-dependent phosphate cotransporter